MEFTSAKTYFYFCENCFIKGKLAHTRTHTHRGQMSSSMSPFAAGKTLTCRAAQNPSPLLSKLEKKHGG